MGKCQKKCQKMPKNVQFQTARGREIPVPRIFLNKLGLFQRQPKLLTEDRYTIACNVDPKVVDLFFVRVMGDETAVPTAETAEQLRALCDELGFSGFDNEIRAVLGGDRTSMRGRVDSHVIIEELQRRVLELERQIREQRVVERVEAVERRVNDVEGAVAEARRETGALREDVAQLRMNVSDRTSSVDVRALSDETAPLEEVEGRRATTMPTL